MKRTLCILLGVSLLTGPTASAARAESPEKEPGLSTVATRSSKLAFLMSLVVPGLGEFYYGARKRAIVFLAVEAGSWTTYSSWLHKGRSIERDFRSYADVHWSEKKYQDWKRWDDTTSPLFYIQTENLPSKAADTQQYYELIGKYDQFVFGWDDGKDAQGRLVGTDYSVHPSKVTSANRLGYEGERNRSNRYLKRATGILGLVVVNHLVSAVDASIHARGRNARLWVGADVIGASEPVPAVRVNLDF